MNAVGFACLGVWLILMGAMQAFDIKFANREKLMGMLAILAGILCVITALKS